MYRQVGDLKVDRQHIAQHGLLVRHLVLPNQMAGTREIMRFLAQEISSNTYLNIMAQYRPCYKASDIPQLARPPSRNEFEEAVDLAHRYGLHRLDSPHPPGIPRFILR